MPTHSEQADQLSQAQQHLAQTDAAALDDQAIHAALSTVLQEVAALRAEVAQLRATVDQQDQRIGQLLDAQPYAGQRYRSQPSQPPVQPPMQRPLDYWAKNIPDYGDHLTPEDVERYLAKPRQEIEPIPVEATPPQPPSWRHTNRFRHWSEPTALEFTILVVLIIGALAILRTLVGF